MQYISKDCVCTIAFNTWHYFMCGFLSDIDECAAGTNMCHQEATCTNTDGNYSCTCNSGYTGDGLECNGKHLYICEIPNVVLNGADEYMFLIMIRTHCSHKYILYWQMHTIYFNDCFPCWELKCTRQNGYILHKSFC